jgi:hypothetical protein
MLQIHPGTRYLFYHKWADVRKSFDGLSGLVINELKIPMESWDVFIFMMVLVCIISGWKKALLNYQQDLWMGAIVKYLLNSYLSSCRGCHLKRLFIGKDMQHLQHNQ